MKLIMRNKGVVLMYVLIIASSMLLVHQNEKTYQTSVVDESPIINLALNK